VTSACSSVAVFPHGTPAPAFSRADVFGIVVEHIADHSVDRG
jgi:hypothetical protein